MASHHCLVLFCGPPCFVLLLGCSGVTYSCSSWNDPGGPDIKSRLQPCFFGGESWSTCWCGAVGAATHVVLVLEQKAAFTFGLLLVLFRCPLGFLSDLSYNRFGCLRWPLLFPSLSLLCLLLDLSIIVVFVCSPPYTCTFNTCNLPAHILICFLKISVHSSLLVFLHVSVAPPHPFNSISCLTLFFHFSSFLYVFLCP